MKYHSSEILTVNGRDFRIASQASPELMAHWLQDAKERGWSDSWHSHELLRKMRWPGTSEQSYASARALWEILQYVSTQPPNGADNIAIQGPKLGLAANPYTEPAGWCSAAGKPSSPPCHGAGAGGGIRISPRRGTSQEGDMKRKFDFWLDQHGMFVIAAAVFVILTLAFGDKLGLLQ